MTRTLASTAETVRGVAHKALVAGLRNAHALEKQAMPVLELRLDRSQDHPELHARITARALESREHGRRIESALDVCNASTSVVKDVMMSVMGLGQASVQGFAEDAVLGPVQADSMFKHPEIASSGSLIDLTELAGGPELRPRLEETLREEVAMAAWLYENLPAVACRHVEIAPGDIGAAKHPSEGVRDPNEAVKADLDAALAALRARSWALSHGANSPPAASESAGCRAPPRRGPGAGAR